MNLLEYTDYGWTMGFITTNEAIAICPGWIPPYERDNNESECICLN